jgi:carboxymethylenebutenolidase
MSLETEWVRFGDHQQYRGYASRLARAAQPLPAVVVVQEAFGVTEHIRDVTDRFARAGYQAFAPDLYTRNGVRPDALSEERVTAYVSFLVKQPPGTFYNAEAREKAIASLPEDEGKRIRETFEQTMPIGSDPTPVVAATKFLRETYAATKGQRVATLGFCMGGRLSGFTACSDPELAAAVVFYGSAPSEAQVQNIGAAKVLGHYASLDPGITNTIPALAEVMKRHGKSFEHFVYEGARHGFFNDTQGTYDVKASRAAFARTLSFLEAHLVGC